MSKLQAPIKFTYEDYKSLTESETKRYELLGGDLVMTPSPTWQHQKILLKLAAHLQKFVEVKKIGSIALAPLDVVLGEDVAQPDIFYISKERTSIIQDEEVRGAPDVVIEILSASTAKRDRTYKRTLYARHGVQEYWLVDPASGTVEILALRDQGFVRSGLYEQDQMLKSIQLAGFEVSVSEIFS